VAKAQMGKIFVKIFLGKVLLQVAVFARKRQRELVKRHFSAGGRRIEDVHRIYTLSLVDRRDRL
jgi:hypothetical protein